MCWVTGDSPHGHMEKSPGRWIHSRCNFICLLPASPVCTLFGLQGRNPALRKGNVPGGSSLEIFIQQLCLCSKLCLYLKLYCMKLDAFLSNRSSGNLANAIRGFGDIRPPLHDHIALSHLGRLQLILEISHPRLEPV